MLHHNHVNTSEKIYTNLEEITLLDIIDTIATQQDEQLTLHASDSVCCDEEGLTTTPLHGIL